MGIQNFKCSASYIQRWRKRHSIVPGKISREVPAIAGIVHDNWIENVWPEIRKRYEDKDIFNTVRTGIFFKMTPDKTMEFKGRKCSRGEMAKDRITLLLATNIIGTEKLKPIIIGSVKSTCCFKNVARLPVTYQHNAKAWITGELFETIFRKWDRQFSRQKRKILLLLDSCMTAHLDLQNLKAIKLVLLPVNASPVFQPLNQRIICAFKTNFRQYQILKMMKDVEQGTGVVQPNLLNALLWVSRAWDHVTQNTIAHCFADGEFSMGRDSQRVLIRHKSSDDVLLHKWVENFPIIKDMARDEDWMNLVCTDDDLETEVNCEDHQIVEEINEDEDVKEVLADPPSAQDAFGAIECVRKFLSFQKYCDGDDSIRTSLVQIEKKIYDAFIENETTRQSVISDFFKPSDN